MDDGEFGYVVLWVLLSVLVGVWAGRRGRSGGRWVLLSLLISPAVTAVCILCFGNLAARTCPACAEDVRKEATVCKHCHRPLPVEALNDAAQRFLGR
jgi:hypothetical protein